MKTKKEKQVENVVRDVGGKNVLFVNDKAVGELMASSEFDYDPGDPTGDVSTGLSCVSYLLESLSQAGNEPVDGMTCWGLSQALQHYAHDVRKYLKPIAESAGTSMPKPRLKVVPLKVCK